MTAARVEAERLFDWVTARAPDAAHGAFRDAAFATRFLAQLATVETGRAELAKFLVENDDLARQLSFLIRMPRTAGVADSGDGRTAADSVPRIFETLAELRTAHLARGGTDKDLGRYGSLVAALCVVRDDAERRGAHLGPPRYEVTPADLFAHFVSVEKRLAFGVGPDVPPELLAHVVDTPVSIAELRWAVGRYGGSTDVGQRYFEIRYDQQAFDNGTEKRVMRAEGGLTLPNIVKYGGVCAEQAYFAANVGKAIGVPSAYSWGRGGDMGHAWVGFLQKVGGRNLAWNFEAGRYEAYQGILGEVMDPQSHMPIPDSYVALLAESVTVDRPRRHASAALCDAALRLVDRVTRGDVQPPRDLPGDLAVLRATSRTAEKAAALDLLRQSVELSPGNARAWLTVQRLALDKRLEPGQRKQWSDSLVKLCGRKYPDFVWDVLRPMVQSVDDPAEQDQLWDAVARLFPDRKDLTAAVRMAQAEMWEQQGDPARAGRCYEIIIGRFANDGPFVLDALVRCEELLSKRGPGAAAELYGRAWRGISKPTEGAPIYTRASNWQQVGKRYAELLEIAGQLNEAAKVRDQLNADARTERPASPDNRNSRPRNGA